MKFRTLKWAPVQSSIATPAEISPPVKSRWYEERRLASPS